MIVDVMDFSAWVVTAACLPLFNSTIFNEIMSLVL